MKADWLAKFDDALDVSGLGAKYVASKYAEHGPINNEAIRIIMRVCGWGKYQPEPIAHTWMNEASFRLYLPHNPNDKKVPENIKNPEKWDFGPLQIHRELYLENVRIKYYRGLPEEDVFGREFFNPDGTPAEFNGNPLINAQAGARHLMRKTGSWETECVQCGKPTHAYTEEFNHAFSPFKSLEEFRVGGYCGPDSRPYRVKSWREWSPYFKEFFKAYGSTNS